LSQLVLYEENGIAESKKYMAKAKRAYQKFEANLESEVIPQWKGLILFDEGCLKGGEKDYESSLKKLLEAYYFWDGLDDPERYHIHLTSVVHMISLTHYHLRDFQESLVWAKRAVKLWEETQSHYHIAIIYNLVGCIQIDLVNAIEAKDYLRKATSELEKLSSDPRRDEMMKCIGINHSRLQKIM
jgi:tetratricopeptide (TPR) repeat protein